MLHETQTKIGVIALDANRLQVEIMKNGFTLGDISDFLGLTKVLTHRKLTDIKTLTIGEAIRLKELLELTDREASEIFLGA